MSEFPRSRSKHDWAVVSIRRQRIFWPKECACCMQSSAANRFLSADSRGYGHPFLKRWRIPYCLDCAQHVDNPVYGQAAVRLWGLSHSALLTVHTVPQGITSSALYISKPVELFYAQISHAVQFRGRDGSALQFAFANHEYARQFASANGGEVSSSTVASPDAGTEPEESETKSHLIEAMTALIVLCIGVAIYSWTGSFPSPYFLGAALFFVLFSVLHAVFSRHDGISTRKAASQGLFAGIIATTVYFCLIGFLLLVFAILTHC